jgi:uncharacterized protein
MLALLFGAVSTVGQAGGTAFLALMAFTAFPPSEMHPTVRALNKSCQRERAGSCVGDR